MRQHENGQELRMNITQKLVSDEETQGELKVKSLVSFCSDVIKNFTNLFDERKIENSKQKLLLPLRKKQIISHSPKQ